MKTKQSVFLNTAVFLLLCTSCADTSYDFPPYVITVPVFAVGERAGYYSYAGVEFEFFNTTAKNVSQVTVSFMLFDSETGQSPFIGSNLFNFTLNGTVGPNEKTEHIIPFDAYLYTAPSEPYVIDFFYIAQIVYADGSVWSDTYGIYHTGSL
ncbi:MAG: hypothetical protein LBL44_01550 [Treponema sp.]|jgi:hypothetical protein|nr:hypothetical protein [Treponema sp.]